MNNLIKQIRELEDIVFENEKSFLNTFCKFCDVDELELTGISFSSESVRIQFFDINGQHFSDSCSMQEFEYWLRTNKDKL